VSIMMCMRCVRGFTSPPRVLVSYHVLASV
jgi:hypothetical protein